MTGALGDASVPSVVVETSGKGKGKEGACYSPHPNDVESLVRPRKAQIAAALANGERVPPVLPKLAALAHKDAEAGGQAGDPDPRYPESITDGNNNQIPKFRATNVAELNQALTRIKKGQPVVLKGCPLLGELKHGSANPGLFARWSFHYLAEALGEGTKSKWEALVSAADKNRFVPYHEGLNVHGSYYHVREPETERMQTSFREFVQCARTWTARRIFLRAVLMARSALDAAADHTPPECLEHLAKTSKTDLQQEINWEWLEESLLKPGFFGGVFNTMLLCGMRGALLPAHYVGYESLYAQLRGRRRILLMDPAQSYQGLYPYPTAHTYDRQSMVDFDAPSYDDWPKFANVKGQVCILEPGELLYVPMFWWRHIQELEDEGIALEFAVHQGTRFRQANQNLLPLGRLVEARVSKAENLRDAKHWLGIIARAEEAEYVDLSSVKGHKQIMMIQGIRDEVDNCLGIGKWQQFLHELIDRRLEPTPWLNVNFREPLYLKDKPVQIEDTRNEIESKFPEFFYNKLSKEGYNVERTPVSVFNPQHPDFIHKDNPEYMQKMAGMGRGRGKPPA